MHPLRGLQRLALAIRRAILSKGMQLCKRTDDRRVLETIILPYFADREGFSKVLFVGCAWYTRRYSRFFAGKDYWTLDIDPFRSRYGSKRLHVTDSLANVTAHFSEGELDLIICNGVFGWGLDAKPEVERAFRGCYECLREGGIFILGWNDIPRRRPFAPEVSEGLQRFRPETLAPLDAHRFVTSNPNRHTYDFYIKQCRASLNQRRIREFPLRGAARIAGSRGCPSRPDCRSDAADRS